MNATEWSRGLEVTSGGSGVVSHAGLLRELACAIAEGGRVISDFRVMGDQRELFGPVASVPTAWGAEGGRGRRERTRRRLTAAVNRARRHGWAQAGPLPVLIADWVLEGTACVRLDATVVQAHGATRNWQRRISKDTGIIRCSRPAITRASRWPGCSGRARPAATRPPITCVCSTTPSGPAAGAARRLMVTCDGAGASHEMVKEPDRLASRHGYQVTRSVGWMLGAREQAAIGQVPESAWEAVIDAKGQVRGRRADERPAGTRAARIPPAGPGGRTSPS